MTCLVDPRIVYSRIMVLAKSMWVKWIEILGAELKIIEDYNLGINFFKTPNHIQPNSHRKHRQWFLLNLVQSR